MVEFKVSLLKYTTARRHPDIIVCRRRLPEVKQDKGIIDDFRTALI